MIDYFLESGADMNARRADGQAAIQGMLAADPSLAARLGPAEKSPLGYAAKSGYTKIVNTALLKSRGAV